METISDFKAWLREEPGETNIAPAPDGGLHIPIHKAQDLLDFAHAWGTQNFHFHLYRNGYADNCIAASIEVYIEYFDDNGDLRRRTFVGACNFSVAALYPNTHFLATAKSMCVKNAIADAGAKFGRGLNAEVIPSEEAKKESNDGVELLNSVDEFKTRKDATKGKNLQNQNT